MRQDLFTRMTRIQRIETDLIREGFPQHSSFSKKRQQEVSAFSSRAEIESGNMGLPETQRLKPEEMIPFAAGLKPRPVKSFTTVGTDFGDD